MSKLDELINELCPNGVEYKPIKDICSILPKKTLKQEELIADGKYPVINSGREFYGYFNQFNNNIPAFCIASRGEYAGFISYIDKPFWAGGLCYPYTSSNEQILTKFIFYYLKNKEQYIMNTLVTRGSIPALNKIDVDKFTIPVAPIEVQKEIVQILDSLTNLISELESELTARKKQYEYYREKLLTFGDEVEWKMLEDCTQKVSNIKWTNTETNYKYIDLSSVNRNNNKIEVTTTINKDKAPSRAQQIVAKDDVLLGTTRPLLKRYCIIGKNYDGQICSTGFCVLRANQKMVLPAWIYYQISSNKFFIYAEKYQQGASYPSITDFNVKNYKIPVPPLEEQQRIVDILDRFDKLCNDISEGLPAEIEARKKQYEYYRDKLLAFKPCDCKKC